MDRWRGKVAVVTGASAGIGLAIAKRLVCEGLTVVGLARRKEKMLNEMKNVKGPGKFFAVECDVSKEKSVDEAFDYIEKTFKTVHILVNNAGICSTKTIEETEMEELQKVINVNFVSFVHCSQKAIRLMKKNGHEAHIIIMNSIYGHRVPNVILPDGKRFFMNVEPATKFALTALSEILTIELLESKIRVTSISPGYVGRTDIGGVEEVCDKNVYESIPHLKAEDVADAITYIVGTPHHVQITELTIKPLGETL